MNKLFAAVLVVFILMLSCTIGQTTNDIEIDEFKKKMASEKYVLVDVRTAEEFVDGYIEGALNIDYFSATFSDEISNIGDLLEKLSSNGARIKFYECDLTK